MTTQGRWSRCSAYLPAFLCQIRWRLSLIQSLILFLCVLACVLVAVAFLGQALTDRARGDMQHTLRGATGYLRHEQSRLLAAVDLVAADADVAGSLSNRQALIDKLTPYYQDLNVDSLDVVDRAGRVIVSMEDTGIYGNSIADQTDVTHALSGLQWVGMDRAPAVQDSAAGWAIRAGAPVRAGSRIVGAVVVGRQLDSAFAAELGGVLNADVNLIVGTHRTGSTEVDRDGLPIVGVAEPPALLSRIASGRQDVAKVTEDGKTVLSGLVPLGDVGGKSVGAVEVVRPLDAVTSVIQNLSVLLLGLGFLIAVLGSLVALAFGRRFTRRLSVLESAASRVVAQGSASQVLHGATADLPVGGRDEVASLARSFDAMMLTLDERMSVNASLYAAAQARVRELSGLATIARLLTSNRSLEETLVMLSRQVCELVKCSAASIYVPAIDGSGVVFGSHGLPDGYAAVISESITVRPSGESDIASQQAYWNGTPAFTFVDEDSVLTRRLATLGHSREWNAATAVPLQLQGRTIGVLTCYTAEHVPLSESDVSLLSTIADQIAIAVENARLYGQAQQLAAVEERQRLARELHDSVTQALFSMTMHARAAQMRADRSGIDPDDPLARNLRELGDLTQGALAEMRSLIFEMRSGALEEEGLVSALRKHVAAVSAREGLLVEIEAPAARVTLESRVEENLYRVAQEALHNIVKHAGATKAWVRVAAGDGAVRLEVADDGVGFDSSHARPGHMGLHTMAERVAQVGGTIDVDSAPGNGTAIRVRVPCLHTGEVETRSA